MLMGTELPTEFGVITLKMPVITADAKTSEAQANDLRRVVCTYSISQRAYKKACMFLARLLALV